MTDIADKIENLDVGLFSNILTQSTEIDKKSLLAAQRATANSRDRWENHNESIPFVLTRPDGTPSPWTPRRTSCR